MSERVMHGITEEELSFFGETWMDANDVEIVRGAMLAKSVELHAGWFSGLHFEPGTELVYMVPVRIKF